MNEQDEQELRDERNLLEAVLDTVDSIVLVLDRAGRIIRFNHACERVSGYSADEVRGRFVWDFLIPPAQIEGVKKVFQSLSSGMFPNKHTNYWIAKDGSPRLISWSNTAITASDGTVQYVVPTGIDITESTETERSLQREKQFSDAVIDSLPGIFYICDESGHLVRWNNNEKEVTGYTIDELSSIHVLDLFREDRDMVALKMREVFELGRSSGEARIVTKAGVAVPFLLTGFRMIVNEQRYLVGVGIDISERKRLEEQLRHAQKMESLGTLAGGIAHDFNNILTAIIGYSNLLQIKIKGDDPIRHHVDQILASANRAAVLTQGLLAYSRRQIINPQPVDLHDIIRRVEALLVRLIGENIELKTILADSPLTVLADAGQIEQILMNLATNSRDAMPDGGYLYIETECCDIDETTAAAYQFDRPGRYAMIAVTDSGIGMAPSTRDRIFEPFFTTKEQGRGTGLGLAIVYGIVKQHDGALHVYSEEGRGTTFKIYFPLLASSGEQFAEPEQPPIHGGTETILVAEDDPDVRAMTCSILEQFGYTVIQAVDGDDAVHQYMANRDCISLLLFDVIMPRKTGREAYDKIRIFNPDVKALFLSGYTADVMHKKGLLETGVNFLMKPVPMNELLRRVRAVIDAPK